MIDFVCLIKIFLYIAKACKWQTFTVHTAQLAESPIMPGTNC